MFAGKIYFGLVWKLQHSMRKRENLTISVDWRSSCYIENTTNRTFIEAVRFKNILFVGKDRATAIFII